MFVNRYTHSIDEKGRLIIPAEYRSELAGDPEQPRSFYVTINLWDPEGKNEPCLCLWPEEAYFRLRDKLRAIPNSSEEVRYSKMIFFSSTQASGLDKQGRTLIIQELKDYAGLDRNILLLGNDENIQIWDLQRWQDYCSRRGKVDTSLWSQALGLQGI